MNLTPVTRRFVLHWGEMGSRWGVNRTVAQIHALLYLSDEPLPAEEIASTLGVARSNVSTSLKELQSWGLVRITHRLGDRRDHFEALADVWEMVRTIMEERKRREFDPTLAMLSRCRDEASEDDTLSDSARQRIEGMHEFVTMMARWYEQISRLPPPVALRLFKMGGKVARLLER